MQVDSGDESVSGKRVNHSKNARYLHSNFTEYVFILTWALTYQQWCRDHCENQQRYLYLFLLFSDIRTIIEEADHHDLRVHELASDLDLDEFVNLDEEVRGKVLNLSLGFELFCLANHVDPNTLFDVDHMVLLALPCYQLWYI